MAEESKSVFTPVEEPAEKPKEEKKVDVEGLIAQLEKVNLTDPDKLKGKLKNAAGFSAVQAEKDRLAHEIELMRSEMNQLKSNNRVNMDDYDFQEKPVDLEKTIESVLDRRDAKRERQQLERQKAQMQAYQKITGSKYWNDVRPLFETKMQDPETNMQVQLGQLDPKELYHECEIEYFKDLSQKSLEALQLSSSNKVAPPHVENSARTPVQETDSRDDKQKKIDALREKAKQPNGLHQDDQMEMLRLGLGDFVKR
jgi:hypothetical protein